MHKQACTVNKKSEMCRRKLMARGNTFVCLYKCDLRIFFFWYNKITDLLGCQWALHKDSTVRISLQLQVAVSMSQFWPMGCQQRQNALTLCLLPFSFFLSWNKDMISRIQIILWLWERSLRGLSIERNYLDCQAQTSWHIRKINPTDSVCCWVFESINTIPISLCM